jgi:predicted small lipoprotein YifL
MRVASLLSALIVLGALAGCGEKGPAKPTPMTPEQEQKFQEDERKAANEETRHEAERRKDRALTPEQQAEAAERQHRR